MLKIFNEKVTICVLSYNHSKVINHCLDSLINQSYRNFEIIIFDDCSTDNSIEIINQYIKKYRFIKLFKNKQKKSPVYNYNKCLKNSSKFGKYFCLFHSDDVYHRDTLLNQVNVMKQDDNMIAAVTDAHLIDINNKVIGSVKIPKEAKKKLIKYNAYMNLLFKYGFFLMMPSIIFRTSLIKKRRIQFNFSRYGWASDVRFFLDMLKFNDIGFINKKLLYYRISTLSTSQKLRFSRMEESDLFKVLNSIIFNKKDRICFEKIDLIKKKNFLLMYDRSLVNINRILNNKKTMKKIFLLKNISLAFDNLINLKKFLIAVTIKVISIFFFRKDIINFLLKLNHLYSIK